MHATQPTGIAIKITASAAATPSVILKPLLKLLSSMASRLLPGRARRNQIDGCRGMEHCTMLFSSHC